jgi:hypothetical protein
MIINMRRSDCALLGALCSTSVRANPVRFERDNSGSVTSVIIFGDSYTDQGVHSYQPGANGSAVLQPVRMKPKHMIQAP